MKMSALRFVGVGLIANVLALLPLATPSFAQTSIAKTLIVSVETPANTMASGTLWLYHFSWYGLERYKLSDIRAGVATVPLDVERLKREVNPHPNVDAFVVVVQAGEHLWFRTPNIEPDAFWADISGAVSLLGKTTQLPIGQTLVVLDPPVKRRIAIRYSDGWPKADLALSVSVYLWDRNHCAHHDGLPLGDFRTNVFGEIEVVSPLVPLYLDDFEYFTVEDPKNPKELTDNIGRKLPADQNIEIKTELELRRFPVELRVLTPDGRPRPNVGIDILWSTNRCGGLDNVNATDEDGYFRSNFDATIFGVTLDVPGPGDERVLRELTSAEFDELVTKGRLTVRW